MTKRPSFPTQMPGGANPTVGLPGSGNVRATVQIPGFSPSAPMRQIIEPASQAAPTQHEITVALKHGGSLFADKKFDEAEKIARLILKFVPRNADAMHLLGLVLHAKGESAEGERLMAKALKIAGPHPVLLVNLGNAAGAQGKFEKALKYYDQAERLFPLHEDIYLERGILRVDNRHPVDALKDFERLIELNPENFAAYSGAAHVASELGQFELAIDYCRRAEATFDEVPIEILAMIAVSYERLSKLPEAIEAAEKVFAINPDYCSVLRAWAKAKRRLAKRDPETLRMLKVRLEEVDLEKVSSFDARVISSELANICEELGDVDSAFAYFQMQNNKTSEGTDEVGADRTSFLNEIEMMLATYSPKFLEKIDGRHSQVKVAEKQSPAFLVGFPRSGTTLLDQIFDAHPVVQVVEERPMVRKLFDAVSAMPGGLAKALSSMSDRQRKELQALYWREAARFLSVDEDYVFIDKMPLSIVHIPVIKTVFPDAKIILALRHPADCSLSCFMQDFETNAAMLNFTSLEGTANLYDLVMTLWERYEEHLTLDVRHVHYEKLITDLRGEVEPVLNFLGLEWDEAMADPAAHARARGTIRTPSYAQVTQPIYGTSADRWRRYEKHIAPMMPKLEKHIRHFGYSL